MRTTLFCSAVLSVLGLPAAAPSQEASCCESKEVHQELRELIRTEVKAAVREALREAGGVRGRVLGLGGGPGEAGRLRETVAKAIEQAEKAKKAVAVELDDVTFDVQIRTDADDDGGGGEERDGWKAKSQTRTFTLPGGRGKVMILGGDRDEDGEAHGDVDVEVHVEADGEAEARRGHLLRALGDGRARWLRATEGAEPRVFTLPEGKGKIMLLHRDGGADGHENEGTSPPGGEKKEKTEVRRIRRIRV